MIETILLWLWGPLVLVFVLVLVRVTSHFQDNAHRKRHHPAE
ncbi:hypothetical protein [Devosia sp. MC532]|nr:hypothetical protein [Devosia sp. MC532]